MQAVIPIMRQQGGGAIINVSSVAGHVPLPFNGAYSASKFAMNALGKGARIELKDENIGVWLFPRLCANEFSGEYCAWQNR